VGKFWISPIAVQIIQPLLNERKVNKPAPFVPDGQILKKAETVSCILSLAIIHLTNSQA
jgi:hypothetical protein